MTVPDPGGADMPPGDRTDEGTGGGDPVFTGRLTTFETQDFSGSGTCATCHSRLFDEVGNDVSIDADWRSTMMGNAAKDPLFLAKVSAEVARNPGFSAQAIEDKCATCHMPMARTQAAADASTSRIFEDGFLDPANPLNEAARDGVSCTVCHQIQDTGLGSPDSFSGQYVIDTSTVAPDRIVFGPFENVDQVQMRQNVGFTPTFGAHLSGSELCASCHTLFTPTLDEQGNVIGEFAEQAPYLEWLHSDFGDGLGQDQTCQDCHMPDAAGGVAISSIPNDLPLRSPFGRHHFVGGNTYMLGIFRNNIDSLELTASAAQFDATIARTREQLENRTATLSVLSGRVGDGVLSVVLAVENAAGHKFPSGYPARQAWIHLVVMDAAETVVFESGASNDDGRITGNDADVDAARFEPHYDTISAADQVQIYETVAQDSDGQVTYTLLRAAGFVKDNRLLPLGFDKATAGVHIAAAGASADDGNFVGGGDAITYQVSVNEAGGPFTVRARLLYHAVGYRFVTDLRRESTPRVIRFGQLHDAADRSPVVVSSVETSVQ